MYQKSLARSGFGSSECQRSVRLQHGRSHGIRAWRSSRPATSRVGRHANLQRGGICSVPIRSSVGRPELRSRRNPSHSCARAPSHEVDAGSPAKHLAHIKRNRASVKMWIWLAHKAQSRSLTMFRGHWPVSMMLGISLLPSASSRRRLTSGFSANRRATTEPDEQIRRR
jgi:hypothetical protein